MNAISRWLVYFENAMASISSTPRGYLSMYLSIYLYLNIHTYNL